MSFFFLTAILPVIVTGTFLFAENKAKLQERYTSLMRAAEMLVQERLKGDLEKLELIANQASFLSISEKMLQYLQSGKSRDLALTLNRLRDSRDLDIVALINSNGQIVESTAPFNDTSEASFKALINAALKGKSVGTIERLKMNKSSQAGLMYIAISPVFAEIDKGKQNKIIGALFIGQSFQSNNSFKQLSGHLSVLKLKVLDHLPASKLKQNIFQKTPFLSVSSKEENPLIQFKHYQGTVLPLKNYFQQTVAYLVIGVSQRIEEQLNYENITFSAIYLSVALLLITLAGFWFNHFFISPINKVAKACEEVVEGNLEAHVDEKSAKGEVQKTIKNFNQMISQLREDEQMRASFISALSHDLRTPLLAQKRVFELLEEAGQEAKDKTKSFLSALYKNNQHLLSMVNILVETYQYEAGKIKLVLEELDLNELMNECCAKLSPLAESKSIAIINTIGQIKFQADSQELKRVFINLISNAIENIPCKKQITLSANIDKNRLKIQIQDNGPGIAPEHLEHIFDRYYSVSLTKQKIGSGLGLYISKMIVEAHAGTIVVKSPTGQGTVFTINLPLQEEVSRK